MIGTQLDLFGGPPRPPKKIRVEEPAPVPEDAAAKPEGPAESDIPPVSAAAGVHIELPVQTDTAPVVFFPEAEPQALPAGDAPHPEATAEADLTAVATAAAPQPWETTADTPAAGETPPAATGIMDSVPENLLPEDTAAPAAAPAAAPDYIPATTPEPEADGQPQISQLPDADLPESTEPEWEAEAATPVRRLQAPVLQPPYAAADTITDEPDEATGIATSKDGPLQIPADDILFSRQYYTMRETSNMFGVNQSLLRYWENEFDVLKPKKNRKGDRYFRPEDIRNLELIYHLLRVRKFTIDGARDYIKSRKKALATFELLQRMEKLKIFLHELKTHL